MARWNRSRADGSGFAAEVEKTIHRITQMPKESDNFVALLITAVKKNILHRYMETCLASLLDL